MRLICVRTKAEYFCEKGWTGLTDLLVVLFCRMPLHKIALVQEANQHAAPHERSAMRIDAAPVPLRSFGLRVLALARHIFVLISLGSSALEPNGCGWVAAAPSACALRLRDARRLPTSIIGRSMNR